jgi:hypothetical protein
MTHARNQAAPAGALRTAQGLQMSCIAVNMACLPVLDCIFASVLAGNIDWI